ncbi:hypothetical protein LTR36_002689 [Oleoguttula mirabilis]|uniref:Uncharacterized protein n=1 Tax=Oleoguttula mirabilis TaxID=1507867 RepID=A0AAV9JKG1_9PEZI|nr:hypothetical protein LTR36_002689 [Oleoguttula mirabilis]
MDTNGTPTSEGVDAQTATLADLTRSSVADGSPNTYTGPPIGFATRAIHTDPYTGRQTKTGHGAGTEPARPVVTMYCTASECLICHPSRATVITVHETMGGQLPMPHPPVVEGAKVYVQCQDWLCGSCSAEVNAVKMGGRSLSELMMKV